MVNFRLFYFLFFFYFIKNMKKIIIVRGWVIYSNHVYHLFINENNAKKQYKSLPEWGRSTIQMNMTDLKTVLYS